MKMLMVYLLTVFIGVGSFFIWHAWDEIEEHVRLANEEGRWTTITYTGRCFEIPAEVSAISIPTGTWITLGDGWFCEAKEVPEQMVLAK